MLLETPEIALSENPDRIIMVVPGLRPKRAREVANRAVAEARRKMPKMSGNAARRLQPLYGKDFFGIFFPDTYTYYQEKGIRAFTMTSLAGKTIPMWVSDSDGKLRAKNPKIKTRVTEDGRFQVLIFRRAAPIGARKPKYVRSRVTGEMVYVGDTVASYPGAPGRINRREPRPTNEGVSPGWVARTNVGVRWRHPGLEPKLFLNNSMTLAAQWSGIMPIRLYLADRNWKGEIR